MTPEALDALIATLLGPVPTGPAARPKRPTDDVLADIDAALASRQPRRHLTPVDTAA